MHITVAICTWNRADLLEKTLDHLTNVIVPDGVCWELLVVNNKCTDHTDTIIERFYDKLPLKRIFEPKQGLSNARNAALTAAQGEYILWTDDDVLVDSQWIIAYLDAFKRWPDAAVFGGKVLPWFEVSPPNWLEQHLDRLGRYFALRDFGDEELILPAGQNPYGANMAFRAKVFNDYQFNPDLGRKGNLLVSGEDAEVISNIRKQGGTVVWIPKSKVQHFLPQDRMTLSYLRKLHYSNGYYEIGAIQNPKRCIAGYPFWFLRQRIKSELLYRWGRIYKPESYFWLDQMMRASSLAGQLAATKIALQTKKSS